MRVQFGKTLVKLAEKDNRIVLIMGDVLQEMTVFIEKFPERFFNVGLTEQSMISIAAGMAIEGLKPIVYSLTPFVLERPYEQVKIDIDEQDLSVILVGYSDYPTHGPTHRPLDAFGLINLFKNVDGYFPINSFQTEKAMYDAYLRGRPSIICLKKEGLPFI